MTSLLKSLIALSLTFALVPTGAFAQGTSAKKKKSTKAKTETTATSAPAATEASPSPTMSEVPPTGVRLAPGEVLNFNTDAAAAGKDAAQVAPGYTFKDSSEPMQAAPVVYNDVMADDSPFKTYIGYPKHRFEVNAAPKGVNAKWTYQNLNFNFRTSTTGYGVAYNFIATPRFGMGVDYNHAALKIDGTTTPVNGFLINSSNTTLDTFFLRTHYCYFGTTNFNIQYCPEFVIGNDAYPILHILSGSRLAMDKVQDLVVGVAMKLQVPVADKMLFHLTPGYNMGTGVGNSGALTSKNNSTIYGLLGVDYEFNTHNGLGIEANFGIRSAKLSGAVGSQTDTWETKSTDIGGKLAYMLTF